jgi:hypothetical protein
MTLPEHWKVYDHRSIKYYTNLLGIKPELVRDSVAERVVCSTF